MLGQRQILHVQESTELLTELYAYFHKGLLSKDNLCIAAICPSYTLARHRDQTLQKTFGTSDASLLTCMFS